MKASSKALEEHGDRCREISRLMAVSGLTDGAIAYRQALEAVEYGAEDDGEK